MQHSISVVIPNYNGKHLLQEYLPYTMAALDQAGAQHEVIVSDDASTDDSVKFIEDHYPQIKIVRSESNQGFSHTVNSGIRLAQQKLVFILNSDVKLKADYFISQWKYFEKPDTFGVMGSIWSQEGGKLMDAAKFPVWKGGQLRSTVNCSPEEAADANYYTLFLSGANALMDREKLLLLGGMDTRYSPFYMEDVDLSVRAWRSGWKCYYEPQAICYHKLSETISKHNKKKKIDTVSRRNKFIFHDTHLEGYKRLLWAGKILVGLLFRWIVLDTDYYRAYLDYRNTEKRKISYPKALTEVCDEIVASYGDRTGKLF